MLNMIEVQLPCTMDHLAVFSYLFSSQWRATFSKTMWRNRHDVGRSVRQPDAGAGEGHLHHVLRKVTRRVHHVLMCGGDAATRRVVIGPKMRCQASATRGVEH